MIELFIEPMARFHRNYSLYSRCVLLVIVIAKELLLSHCRPLARPKCKLSNSWRKFYLIAWKALPFFGAKLTAKSPKWPRDLTEVARKRFENDESSKNGRHPSIRADYPESGPFYKGL